MAAELHPIVLSPEASLSRWEDLRPFAEQVVPYLGGRVEIEDIEAEVERGDYWVMLICGPEPDPLQAVLFLKLLDYPRKKVLAVALCSGENLKDWVHLWPAVRSVAEKLEADQIEVAGRPGWIRAIPDTRLGEVRRVYIEDIAHG